MTVISHELLTFKQLNLNYNRTEIVNLLDLIIVGLSVPNSLQKILTLGFQMQCVVWRTLDLFERISHQELEKKDNR